MSQSSRAGDRVFVAERGIGYFVALGAIIGVPVAALIGVIMGHSYRGTAGYAGLEGILLFAWVGPVLGAIVGVVNEITRPARQRRMLARRDR